MTISHRYNFIVGLAALGSVAIWVPSALAATAEERAKCEEMVKTMGSAPPHDHGMDKGQGPGPMTAEHARCKQILAEPAHGHKEETGKPGSSGDNK